MELFTNILPGAGRLIAAPFQFVQEDLKLGASQAFQLVVGDLSMLWLNLWRLLPSLAIGFVILALFVVLSRPLSVFLIKPVGYVNSSKLVNAVVRRAVQILFILLGLYIFLRLAGLTHFAVAVLSGTGVIGIILGFAFRDIAENFIASLLLSMQHPFRIGDVVEVEGQLGVVNKVTSRSTTLVDYDGNHIQIPNATIYKGVIRNMTANPRTRGHFQIGIGYDSSIVKAQTLALDVLKSQYAVLDDPEPQILVSSLGASSIVLNIYFWINTEKHSLPKVASLLMRLVMREFERNNFSMPDDAREIIFPQGVPITRIGTDDSALSPAQPDDGAGIQATPVKTDAPQVPEAAVKMAADTANNPALDDIQSDTGDIREQAANSRDPEAGKNII